MYFTELYQRVMFSKLLDFNEKVSRIFDRLVSCVFI